MGTGSYSFCPYLTMYTISPNMQPLNPFSGACLHHPYPTSPSHSMSCDTAIMASMSAMSAPSTLLHKADSPTLKRAFSTPNSSFPSKKLEHSFTHSCTRPSTSPQGHRLSSSAITRLPRLATPTRILRPSMVQTSARSFMPMPSFGSVFGGEPHTTGNQDHANVNGGNVARPASSGNTTTGAPFSSFHMHHDSRDSNSTGSSDNSPTTTISTMDSSSVTDPSPGVSPESPLAKTAAASSFVADFRSRRPETSGVDSSPSNFFELARPTTPAKKPRNLKNLGINTATSLTNLRAHTPAPIAVGPKERVSSAPPSPLFIKPPTPPKRRPSNLSLTISPPGSTENKPVRLIIPSTPSFNRPALRHFQSSPSLPLCSPGKNPFGGMQLPPLRPLVTKASGLSEVPFEMEEEEEDQEPNFDIPQSREEKPAAYPNGPICIYEAGVYLYFEPTAEQAMTFDVIINVASEVKNPFTSAVAGSQKHIDARRVDGPPAENVDFASLSHSSKPNSLGKQGNSPTTPKAIPLINVAPPHDFLIDGKTYKTPEYVHVPWEHNTDIVPDLHKLVKMMDDRVQQGKRILVHCQCGVSRSASLIVAYGLYKNPNVSVQEAYDIAKKRSRWIGPNMNLIMQLQEFRNGLLRQNENRGYLNSAYGRRSAGLPTARSAGAGRYTPFHAETPSGPRTPQTAPLPPDCDISLQRASTGNIIAISPGPLSAPTGAFPPGFRRSWDSSQTHFDLSSQAAPHADLKDDIVPKVSISDIHAASPSELSQHGSETNLRPASIPNFSRQLPLRTLENSSDMLHPHFREAHLGLLQPQGVDALKSPAVASFNLHSMGHQNKPIGPELMSPIKASFDANPWLQGYDIDPQRPTSTRTQEVSASTVPMSHTSTAFGMTSLNSNINEESSSLVSPRTTSFNPNHNAETQTSNIHGQDVEISEIASPVTTRFPRDVFSSSDGALVDQLKSPRSTEFHMTPLKPRIADADPFGLTSPTRAEFSESSFGRSFPMPHEAQENKGRVPFQAILPPSHQTFNGFASLDGTAQTHSSFESVAGSTLSKQQGQDVKSHNERLNMMSKTKTMAPAQSHMRASQKLPILPELPRKLNGTFLSTPTKSIQTRFSSPNLREQRRLHQLQTEIQSKLSNPSFAQHAADDMDTLMSPRAEEFTRNPFHVDLPASGDDISPTSSNETIKDGRDSHDWKAPQPPSWTPEKATVDPRSPVQTGSNPIVRNILDVL